MPKHEILFERVQWTSNRNAKRLRMQPTLRPELDSQTHTELHRNCPLVPLLGTYALDMVSDRFTPGRDVTQSVNSLLMAIDSIEHSKLHPVQKELAQLALFAIELQIEYVR